MKKESFSTSFITEEKPEKLFEAINNVRGWWSENIEGATDHAGSEFEYTYQDVHRSKMKITTYSPNKQVIWHVLDNYFKFTKDKTEWTGTDVIFDIKEKNGKTELIFTHRGLTPNDECYQVCHDAWTHYIQGSLKNLVEKGKGAPTPGESGDAESSHQSASDKKSNQSTSFKSIYHRLLIEAPAEKVYESLTTQKGLAGWWTPDTVAQSETGSVLKFTFEPDYTKEMRVDVLKPYSLVKWTCLKGFEDWIGTTLSFELHPHAKGTVLLFHHDGWKEYTPEFASCTHDWGLFFRSLKLLCETGKGKPYPEFNK